MARKVYGAGVFEKGVHTSDSRAYKVWRGMLRRCYDPAYKLTAPAYAGCGVSDDFLNFQTFARWAVEQHGYYEKGWQLDKDLLTVGNKVYSAEACVFLPTDVNNAIVVSSRGELPMGVEKHGPSYRAYWDDVTGVRNRAGPFQSVDAAFDAYKAGKQVAVRAKAVLYKDKLDNRAYTGLLLFDAERRFKWDVN